MDEPDELPALEGRWDRELWVLDPGPFIDIAFDQGVRNFVFRAKMHEAPSRRQDWGKFLELHARGRPWRAIWVPYPGAFAVAFDSERGVKRHTAVWPLWRGTQKIEDLERLIAEPWDEDTSIIRGYYGADSRHEARPVKPVKGQERRILVAGMPKPEFEWINVSSSLLQLAEEGANGHILHFHGQKSIPRTIGIRVPSFDHPVRIDWEDGLPRILLPNGGVQSIPRLADNKDAEMWVKIIGFNAQMLEKAVETGDRSDLARLCYDLNLRSLRWAHLNFDRAWDFRRGGYATDDEAADAEWEPPPAPVRFTKRRTEDSYLDRWLCDTCSLNLSCPYSREGSVCIVSDSEAKGLAEQFKTRNSGQILDALASLLAVQGRRLDRAMEIEEDTGNLHPEVTKILNGMFDRGVTLAKLVDPVIAGRTKPSVNVGVINAGAAGAVAGGSKAQLMAGVVAELEKRGIPANEATPDQVRELLEEHVPPEIIDATSVEGDHDEEAD